MSIVTRATALLLAGALGMNAQADEEKIALDKVPAAAMKAVKARFPKAKVTGAEKVVEDGETTYEITLKAGEDTVSVSVEADGEINEVERSVEVEDLPGSVVAAVKAKYPKAKIKSAESLFADGRHSYEVVVEHKGKEVEVVVAVTAQIVEADNADDDEKADDENGEKKEKKTKEKKDEDADKDAKKDKKD